MAGSSGTTSSKSMVTQISPPEKQMADSTSKDPSPAQASTSYISSNLYNMTPDLLNTSFNVTLKLLSPAASSGPFCRICLEGDNLEDLVSLCKCTGSVGLVHFTCMERWLNARRSGHDKCEICNYTFETVRSPKSLSEWYRSDRGAMSSRHNILGYLACCSLISPLSAVSIYLCLQAAKRHVTWNNSLEAGCLMALSTFLITIYIVWNILTIRFHLRSYLRWRSVNQNVRLVRFRRKCTDVENQAVNQRTRASTAQGGVNDTSPSASVTNDQQMLPHTSSESDDVNAETSNLCLTDA